MIYFYEKITVSIRQHDFKLTIYKEVTIKKKKKLQTNHKKKKKQKVDHLQIGGKYNR